MTLTTENSSPIWKDRVRARISLTKFRYNKTTSIVRLMKHWSTIDSMKLLVRFRILLLSQGRLDDLSWWGVQEKMWLSNCSKEPSSLEESCCFVFCCHFNCRSWAIISLHAFAMTYELKFIVYFFKRSFTAIFQAQASRSLFTSALLVFYQDSYQKNVSLTNVCLFSTAFTNFTTRGAVLVLSVFHSSLPLPSASQDQLFNSASLLCLNLTLFL